MKFDKYLKEKNISKFVNHSQSVSIPSGQDLKFTYNFAEVNIKVEKIDGKDVHLNVTIKGK